MSDDLLAHTLLHEQQHCSVSACEAVMATVTVTVTVTVAVHNRSNRCPSVSAKRNRVRERERNVSTLWKSSLSTKQVLRNACCRLRPQAVLGSSCDVRLWLRFGSSLPFVAAREHIQSIGCALLVAEPRCSAGELRVLRRILLLLFSPRVRSSICRGRSQWQLQSGR